MEAKMAGSLRGWGGGVLCLAVLAAGCNIKIESVPGANGAAPAAAPGGAFSSTADRGQSLRIATFNIQVFGQSKLDKPEVMDVLARTVRRFDVVAIQEVRSADQDVLPRFVEMLNADGSRYGFVIGPRLGRTSSKEQYAFVFDTTRVALDPQSVYTISDPEDLLHREPLAARFQAQGPSPGEAFTFTLVNIHTDPDETDQELDALDDVFRLVQSQGEDDVIVLGDLNVDDRHLGELGRLPGITWAIAGRPTNTRQNKQYDNLVFDQGTTVEYTGSAGVLDLQSEFALTLDQALDVSDHLPVWAEFSPYENQSGRTIAARPEGGAR
jgi:endonuclease/exonuclease/phosphatase family metal-dependent hydrolase